MRSQLHYEIGCHLRVPLERGTMVALDLGQSAAEALNLMCVSALSSIELLSESPYSSTTKANKELVVE
jgi:hypothetical protein